MRLSLRLILFLVVGISLVTFVISRNQVRAEKRGLRADLERRAAVLAESLQEIVEPALGKGSRAQLRHIVDRFEDRQHLAGVIVYDASGNVLAASSSLDRYTVPPVPLARVTTANEGVSEFLDLGGTPMNAYYLALHDGDSLAGVLAIFHDASYIEAQSKRIWRETIWHVIAEVLLVVFVTVLIIRWTIVLPISRTAQWMKDLRSGRVRPRPELPKEAFLAPFSQEVVNFARSLTEARAAAEEEARLRETGESLWTPERLRVIVQTKLLGSLFVVSNREPYMHEHHGKNIEAVVPASGLVTALEPILRACDGTWIAHGSGEADREVVDERDRLRVPPDKPEYTLRRVWLTKEEEQGYYYGFSNEGLWPLCHIAHTRPLFRSSDWQSYQDANRKFADAVLEEMAGAEHALLLVQDYHFALLPRIVKEARPDVRVAIFWHIPWPNPEAFGICPWQRELLPPWSPLEINALQRASTIVIQKSLREGFGLTVTEGLWKKKPVVASAVGGIPAQVIHKHTGMLAHSVEGTAYQIRFLLSNPAIAQRLGEHGHEHVREHFLITGNVRRYLTLFHHLLREN